MTSTVDGVETVTTNGAADVDLAIGVLNALEALPALTRSTGINMAAKVLVDYQKENGGKTD